MNDMMALCMSAAIGAAAASVASAAGDATSMRASSVVDDPAEITLVSVADPACEGGLGFRRIDGGPTARDTFAVPDNAVFIASDIRWHARAPAFDSRMERVALEVGRSTHDDDAGRASPRAVVNGTHVGGGRAEGGRTYASGIAFESGTTLCGHVRTRNPLVPARTGEAHAVIQGRVVRSAQAPRHADAAWTSRT